MRHALNWLEYEATGKAPWKNEREFKRHKPTEQALAEARRIRDGQ